MVVNCNGTYINLEHVAYFKILEDQRVGIVFVGSGRASEYDIVLEKDAANVFLGQFSIKQ
jgi:hypothetical protein